MKKQLCRDVGNGLIALHACSVVHGDIKSENVLVCNTPSGTIVAKLADFGCAITDLEETETIRLPAFTLPWNAPECHVPLPRDLLKYTHVYSYGLLLWRVTLNGVNPFRLVNTLAFVDRGNLQREIEILKFDDRFLPMAKSTVREFPGLSDEETTIVCAVLDSTLHLDAACCHLHGSVAILSDPMPAASPPNDPLIPCDYEHVSALFITPSSSATGSQCTKARLYGSADLSIDAVCLELSLIRELGILSETSGKTGDLALMQLFQMYMGRLEWPQAEQRAFELNVELHSRGAWCIGLGRYAERISDLLGRSFPGDFD